MNIDYEQFIKEKVYVRRIRELREDHNYTQQYVADYLSTSQTMYARYERDASAMPIRHLYYLSKLYNVSSDYIIGLTDEPHPPNIKKSSDDKKFGIHWKTSE